MSFPTYAEYKNSGIEWLDEIPEHWDIKELKYACSNFPSNVDKKTVEGQQVVSLCNYTDVYYNDLITADMKLMKASATDEQIEKFTLRAGDVIITKDSESADDIAVSTYIPADLPGIVCGYHLAMIRPNEGVSGLFIKRLFDSVYIQSKVATLANGLTRMGLSHAAISGLELPIPPAEEQNAIANFLDTETAKIDALVTEQWRLIELLKEKRQAVISHAVTKGLNPDAPLKDSGIEWPPKIPTTWEVVQLRRQIELQRGVDITKDTQIKGTVPVISSGGISSFHNAAIAKGPGVILGRKGSVGSIHYVEQDYWPHDTTLYIKDFHGNSPRFVYYKMYSLDLSSYDTGSSNPTLNRNILYPVKVPWPSLKEQNEIVERLDIIFTKFDNLEVEVVKNIELLQERRTALISAAVTGKIDVREYAAKETA